MKNRIMGMMIIGIAVLMGFIIYSFNRALTKIVNTACSHGPTCPMWGTIDFQTKISLGIMVFVILIGLYLIFFGTEKKIITRIKTLNRQIEHKEITKEDYRDILRNLSEDERLILEKVIESNGTIFQSDLVDNAGFTKVKVTRILDRLEGSGFIERKRRGMTNVVILKPKNQ